MKTYGKTIIIKITGMSCPGCASSVEQALRGVAGVKEVQVNLEAGTATVNLIPGDMDPGSLLHAVKMAGYEGRLAE